MADWGDRVSASCTVGPLLSVSADSGWPHNALRHHWLMPISCDFRDCKALLVTSLTHVSGAIASVQTFTFSHTKHWVGALNRGGVWCVVGERACKLVVVDDGDMSSVSHVSSSWCKLSTSLDRCA